jgi:hypothetical protein
MASSKLPWVLRGTDFSREGWHTQPTAGYQLMFEFLRISPSYELARKARHQGLTAEEKSLLPKDFELVLKTYDLLGDVNCVLFRSWWLKRGLKAFGNPYSKPKIHGVSLIQANEDLSLSQLENDIRTNLLDQRRDEGLSASLLISVPLTLKTTDVLRQLKKLLTTRRTDIQQSRQQPKITLSGKRLHVNAIFKGLRLLWIRATKPKWELWRLGTYAKFSDSYSNILDPNGPKKIISPIDVDDRRAITKITFRALVKFQFMAENAARGKFPSSDPVEISEFEYPLIAKRLAAHAKWVKSEKSKLSGL